MPPYGQQPPPGYFSPPPGYAPPPAGATSKWGPSSMGMEPNITAGLAYLIGIIAIIFLFMEKQNRFARFHVIQSLLLRAATFIVLMAWLVGFFVFLMAMGNIVDSPDQTAVSNTVGTGFILLFLCYGVILLADLVTTIWGIVAGFSGRMVKFPVIGALAERWVGGPVVPLY